MHTRSACLHILVTLSLSEAGPGRFGRQPSSTDFYHTTTKRRTLLLHEVVADKRQFLMRVQNGNTTMIVLSVNYKEALC